MVLYYFIFLLLSTIFALILHPRKRKSHLCFTLMKLFNKGWIRKRISSFKKAFWRGLDRTNFSSQGGSPYIEYIFMTEGDQASKKILEILHAHQPAVRRFEQSFSYARLTIAHEHTVEIKISEDSAQKMEIRNHYSVLQGQRLMKLTEVYFQNRVVRIFDNLALLLPEQGREGDLIVEENQKKEKIEKKDKDEKTVKRKQIIKRKARSMGANRDTRNVVKNIIRMFKNWLKSYPNQMAICSPIFEKRKFNNSLVFSIAHESTSRKAFIQFLHNSAQKMLEQSKVHDKNAHLSALQNYKSLCLELQKEGNAKQVMLKCHLESQREHFQ